VSLYPEWVERAACRAAPKEDVDDAFGFLVAQRAFIDRFCVGCPVRQECLEYAGDHPGVYGGLTETERKALRPRTGDTEACGTVRGYRRHYRRHEDACDPCREAQRARDRRNYARRKEAA
jgi:WhiB family redox-sensing transcriptional regulator